jgi:hypothetical protein
LQFELERSCALEPQARGVAGLEVAMRLLPIALILAACLLVVSEPWSQAGPCEAPKPGFRHVLSMHFENRDTAPLHFEVELDRKNGPRTILTNLHSAPLTAYVEQIMPVPSQQPQHIGAGFRVVDALLRSGLLSPVPRGLSVIGSVEHIIGEPYPQVTLVGCSVGGWQYLRAG